MCFSTGKERATEIIDIEKDIETDNISSICESFHDKDTAFFGHALCGCEKTSRTQNKGNK